MFAAQAGAAKVIAVDMSDIIETARLNVEANGLTDIITFVKGKIEDDDVLLPIEPNSADLIVSEWMGYALLYECMLPSVLAAKAKWMKTGGMMFPNTASISVHGFEERDPSHSSSLLTFWDILAAFLARADLPVLRELCAINHSTRRLITRCLLGTCQVVQLRMQVAKYKSVMQDIQENDSKVRTPYQTPP